MQSERRLSPPQDHWLSFSSFSSYRNAIYGVAALWIVMFHGMGLSYIQMPESLWLLDKTFRMGNVAVDIFIFLSGVGLYFSFSKGPKLGDFYKKRFVRVYIPYLLMTLPYIIYCLVDGQIDVPLMIKAILTINFWTNETTPIDFWYISLVLVLYLLYPLIYKFMFRPVKKGKLSQGKREFIRMLMLVLVTLAVSLILFYFVKDVYVVIDRALSRIAAFIVGCYFGKLVKEKKRFNIVFLILSVAVFIGAYPLYVGAESLLHGVWARYYGSLTGIALVFILSQLFILLSYIKIDKILAFFGAFSLEIYIMSILGRKLFYNSEYYVEGGHNFRNYMIWMVVSIVAAYAVYWIEKPITKLLLRKRKE